MLSPFDRWDDFYFKLSKFKLGLHMSLCMRKPTILVSTRSDTNRAVQSQKMVRGWKFWI